uniref:Synaptobrevin, longin-like domain protein n=1 Tax=Tanacetum cinerariifolium TaxID=118510 RepID=A0A699HXL1_TANCI|nr:hypothetical protein [Tanacetum cinerariifolium]
MARLAFCDYHNMVAILEKSEHNVDFHPIVDFVEASPLRIETMERGIKILATIDGNLITVFESSIRRNLKLNDEAGISSLPDAELFENLTLCLSPKSTRFNEFSSNIATALVWLATNRVYNFSKMIFDGMGEGSGTPTEPHHTPYPEAQQTSPTTYSSPTLPPVTTANIPPVIPTAPLPTVVPTDTPHLRHYTRRARIAQSSALLPVADEPASPLRDVSQGEACPTISSLDAEQDRANIDKTSTLPHESTSRVTSLSANEGSMQHKLDELTALCTSLQRQQSEMVYRFEAQELEINSLKARIKLLEDKDRGVAEHSGYDAPIKRRRLDVGEEAAERASDDTEEMATVLTSMDATTVLASGVAEVPTGSGYIPTAGPPATGVSTGSDVVPTAGSIFTTAHVVTPYTRRKGNETMVESETPKKKKVQEKIDAQVARELEEKMAKEDQRMSEQIARDVEIARIHVEEELQIMIDGLDRNNETEEVKRFKRKGIRFEQESAKKLKTSKEVPEEVKTPDEVPEEKVKEMMQLVPIEEVYVEDLQVKHLIIYWKVHTEGQRSYWKITRLEGSSASFQFFVDLLKHLYRKDLNQLWALVKESLNIRPASSDKEMELWVELKRLVHHVTSKDNEIFLLIEKDYPLRKGLAIVMISYKLQVENYSQMANDLIMKIYKIATMEQLTSMCDMVGQYIQKKEEEKQIKEEQAAKARYWKIHVCYDDYDDEDYTIAITHKEPDNSLSMGDEHLDTIPAKESDEFIKSSVENLVPNLTESVVKPT